MSRPFLSVLLVLALLAISAPGASGAVPAARAAHGKRTSSACAPLIHVGGGHETCYLPARIGEAEAQLVVPPVNPSPAIRALTGLSLDQIVRYRLTTPPGAPGSLLYIYGTLPPIGDRAFFGSAPFPPPRAHPRYMIVEEAPGVEPALHGLFLGRPIQFGPDGKTPTSYGAWHLYANFPHRDLQLTIVSDATRALTRRVGRAIIATDERGPVVPSPFVRLSLSVPASTYPRNALVRVTVRLRNISAHPIHLNPPDCGTRSISVDVLNAAGRILYPPILAGTPLPNCGVTTGPGRSVAPGQTLTITELVVLRGWRVQARADITEAGTILGAPERVTLTRADPPVVAVHTQPDLHADLTRPARARGPLWYFAWGRCRSGESGQSMTGMLDWRSAAGTRLPAAVPQGCTGSPEWHALAGWVGHTVAHIDHTGG